MKTITRSTSLILIILLANPFYSIAGLGGGHARNVKKSVDIYLSKYSGTYSVEIGKSDWGETYVLTSDGKAKWMFLDARTKTPTVMQTLTGTWTAKESYINISITASPNGVEEYTMKNGVFYSKAKFKRYLKRTN
jgi:hypothetical protein